MAAAVTQAVAFQQEPTLGTSTVCAAQGSMRTKGLLEFAGVSWNTEYIKRLWCPKWTVLKIWLKKYLAETTAHHPPKAWKGVLAGVHHLLIKICKRRTKERMKIKISAVLFYGIFAICLLLTSCTRLQFILDTLAKKKTALTFCIATLVPVQTHHRLNNR